MLFNIVVCPFPELGGHQIGFNFLPAGGQFIKHGYVKLTVYYQCKCARNRRGGHDIDMRIFALEAERAALFNAETVLFIGYHKPERVKFNIRLYYCVRADQQVYFTVFERRFLRPFLSRRV